MVLAILQVPPSEGVVNGKVMSIVGKDGRMRRMLGEGLLDGGLGEARRGGGGQHPLLVQGGAWGGAGRGIPCGGVRNGAREVNQNDSTGAHTRNVSHDWIKKAHRSVSEGCTCPGKMILYLYTRRPFFSLPGRPGDDTVTHRDDNLLPRCAAGHPSARSFSPASACPPASGCPFASGCTPGSACSPASG